MSYTCFEPQGSPSGRRLCVPVRYNLFTCQRYKRLYRWHVNKLYRTCTYIHPPEDEPSSSKHAEDIVITKYQLNKGAFGRSLLYDYIMILCGYVYNFAMSVCTSCRRVAASRLVHPLPGGHRS